MCINNCQDSSNLMMPDLVCGFAIMHSYVSPIFNQVISLQGIRKSAKGKKLSLSTKNI